METNNTENVRTISISDLMNVFRKCWIIMLAVVILVGALTVTYAVLTYQEIYTAESSLVVIRDGTGSGGAYTTSDYSVDLYMVNDVAELINTQSFLNMVAEDLKQTPDFSNKNITVKSLRKSIKVITNEDSRFVYISNTAKTKQDAELIAHSICYRVEQEILKHLDADSVSIVDNGYTENIPSNSVISLMHLAIPVLAALMVYVVYLIFYVFDDKIKTQEDVDRYLGLNVLGMIPNIDSAGKIKSRYYTAYYGKYGQYQHTAQADSTPQSK